ncbi:hypothetical protein MKY59_21640 [Paenibacillus sp. FSL W8-0426]|uniref:hypothetical protein n=1 Tax=Paenibacillus sp. FSL W8-0426 TaxID=2921714 RepID=UPI0030D954DA
MAKLNVVIPAVEVTVEVNGRSATYCKVDRKAQAGDIVKALGYDIDIDKGAFYAVYADSDGDLVFADNNGDERPSQLRGNSEMYEVYAPISEPATVTVSETITFQGAEWRKVDRAAREGDAIKFTDEDRDRWLTDAELYVVDRIDSCDDPQITDDDGDSYDAGGEDYEVYEKVTEVAADYREVNRKARVGERIRVVAIHPESVKVGNVRVGEEFTVKTVDSSGDIWSVEEREFRGLVSPSYHGLREYVVLEPVAPTEHERLKVGEYARFVEDGTTMMRTGDIVEITDVDLSTVPYRVKRLSDGKLAWTVASRLVRATDEEVTAAKRATRITQFSVGDSVKLTVEEGKRPRFGYGCVSNGDIGKVTRTGGDRIFVDFPTHDAWMADPSELTKLTAEEVAEEEARRREEAKWAAIGRKVNEFKRGDIVEVKHPCGAPLKSGDLVTVKFDSNSEGSVKVTDIGWAVSVSALIVPVEQRFDRPEEVDAA